jgi:hypothetical protein
MIIMTMPKEILVIKPGTSEIMKTTDVYSTFGIDDHQLANCINCGKSIKTAEGDVFFDVPLD